jgi:hypothetical protein
VGMNERAVQGTVLCTNVLVLRSGQISIADSIIYALHESALVSTYIILT